jgi:hypothetical protein
MRMEEEDVEFPSDQELMDIEEEDLYDDFEVISDTIH